MRLLSFALASLALTSCCGRPCGPCAPTYATPEPATPGAATPLAVIDFGPPPLGLQPGGSPPETSRWPERVPAPLPPGFADELRRIHDLTDSDAKRAALAALHAKSPGAFADVDVPSLARVAPDVLRVYDLSAVLADGGDYPETVLPPLDPAAKDEAPPVQGPEARVLRILSAVAWSHGPGGWPESSTFFQAVGTHLVVLHGPSDLAAVEGVLDVVATTGGPVGRLRVDVLRGAKPLATSLGVGDSPAGGWETKPVAAPPESALAPLRIDSFTLDVPYGRSVGARRSSETAYVKDYEVEASHAVGRSETVVGTMREGCALTADLGPESDGPPRIHIALQLAALVQPIPTFSTSLGGGNTVTIEIPELRVQRFEGKLGAATPSAYLLTPTPDGTSALLRVEPVAGAGDAKPAWKRITPGSVVPPAERRLATVEIRAADAEGTTVTAPRVSVLVGQRANVSVVNELPYVQGFRLDGATKIADPTVASVVDGMTVDVTPLPGDGAVRTFDVRVAFSQLDLPMRRLRVLSFDGPEIQLPSTRDVVLPFRVALKPGGEERLMSLPVRVETGPAGAVVATRKEITVFIRYVGEEAVR